MELMRAFIPADVMALSLQYLVTVRKEESVTEEYERVKHLALLHMPEDQQSPLRDVYPSTSENDYTDEMKEIAATFLNNHKKELEQMNG